MKSTISNSKTTIFLLTLILVFAPMFGYNFGQGECPALVRVAVSAEGCTKKSALANLTTKISTEGTATCTRRVCSPSPPTCILNHVILIGKKAKCKKVADTDDDCHGKKKWVCTRDVNYDCQCFGDDGTSENSPKNFSLDAFNEKAEEKTFELFPNPATLQLHMKITGFEGKTELLLSDPAGRVVLSKHLELRGKDLHSIDISSLPEGMYRVSLIDNSTRVTIPFLKN